MNIKLTKLPKSEIELQVVVDEKEFAEYRDRAFKAVQQYVEVDGFRKGNVPEDVIVKKYGDMVILEEMANLAMRDAYVKAIEGHKFNPVADPKVTVKKLAKDNPLELSMIVPVLPEITLPSYKKIAKEVNEKNPPAGGEVTDKDIDDVVEELRKGRSHQHAHEHDHEGHDHEKEEGRSEKAEENQNATLPELNDEFAQSFGPDFKTLADLRAKVGENMKLEKEQKAKEKRRTAIMDKLIEETKTDIPEAIVENELANMLAQFKADITRYGGTWEGYLTQTKKTEDEIKLSWRSDALRRAMSQLIIHKIAEAEKLTATDEEIEVELVRLLTQVQDADEARAKNYLYQALTNDKVLKFLEESK